MGLMLIVESVGLLAFGVKSEGREERVEREWLDAW
jgi:hypothetical protein